MPTPLLISALCALLATQPPTPPAAQPDLRTQLTEASRKAAPAAESASTLLREGKPDEATALILATFPESTRTPVQSLVLANILFQQEPRLAYALHKQAAAALPDYPSAQLEWALEQHRSKEYDGAIASYTKFSAANPDHAPALGLIAECLIRTGKVREAADAWKKSEQAGGGTLEELESLVCELHSPPPPDRDRAAFMAKARTGDIDAAERLILMDCDWKRDWWNAGPHATNLRHDLALVVDAPIARSPRREAILCAGECWLARSRDEDQSTESLKNRGFFIDPKSTLPESGAVLSSILGAATEGDALTVEDARKRFGDRILDMARKSKDPAAFNAAAHLFLGTPRLAEIDKLGWDATGDSRFATSYIVGQYAAKALTLASPDLIKALKQFPEDAEIAHIAVLLAQHEGKPLQPYLIAAIKAEYTHFSIGESFSARPSARALRKYFAMLSKELASPAAPTPPSK